MQPGVTRSVVVGLCTLVATIGIAGVLPAQAITGGQETGDAYGNVGYLLIGPTGLYCTGTLISPNVVVTAAHCVGEGDRVEVTFSHHVEFVGAALAGPFIEGTAHFDPRATTCRPSTEEPRASSNSRASISPS